MLDIMLMLLCVWLFCVPQLIDGDNAAVSCADFMQDWYPSVKPQSSVAPYTLNVSDENDNFSQWSWRSPTYGSKTVQTDHCAGPQCANKCPNGYAKTKFGCTTCTCAGKRAITGSILALLFAIGLYILLTD